MLWIQAVIYTVLPLFFFIKLYKGSYASQRLWFIEWILAAMFIGFIFVLGPWHIFMYYLRYVWLLLFIIVSFISFKKIKPLPKKGPKQDKSNTFSAWLSIVLAIYFGVMMVLGLSGYWLENEDQAIDLAFPLQSGVYAVGHGGSHSSINYHHTHPEQRYAYDILQLNKWGLRARGLTPSELENYNIYNTPIYSPCAGSITEAVDQYEDIPPLQSETDPEDPAGNHVAISCQNADVYIAHIRPGTVTVEEGDEVTEEDVIGKVGNTGNTTEPHLHIHAVRDGEGIPITYGRFLKRNSLVFRE
ncbi:M23 family metallopeptidase [Thalassobacillus sp. CUG 92003]|uniref:M23 family metallopeptidase n=1 Tax=Thalassobacillus sp. CUG 92003 TaxID=2736641 RepID=UPI0015E6AB3E|nr:M23 family metallopeptidase [Thalassobacillus sp. CUG 92003]